MFCNANNSNPHTFRFFICFLNQKVELAECFWNWKMKSFELIKLKSAWPFRLSKLWGGEEVFASMNIYEFFAQKLKMKNE